MGARYWKTECGALTAKGVYRDHDLVLATAKLHEHVRRCVKQLMNAYGVDAEHLIVVHDELDIDPGTVRVKFGGGRGAWQPALYLRQAGNARLASRARVGIRRPPGRMPVVDWVLSKPKKDYADDFAQTTDRGAQAALSLVQVGLEDPASVQLARTRRKWRVRFHSPLRVIPRGR